MIFLAQKIQNDLRLLCKSCDLELTFVELMSQNNTRLICGCIKGNPKIDYTVI